MSKKRDTDESSASPRPDAHWSPPIVLAREMWDDLYALEGDAGARQILDGHPELLDTVPAPGRPDDIDTPEDYAKILTLFPRRKSRKRA